MVLLLVVVVAVLTPAPPPDSLHDSRRLNSNRPPPPPPAVSGYCGGRKGVRTAVSGVRGLSMGVASRSAVGERRSSRHELTEAGGQLAAGWRRRWRPGGWAGPLSSILRKEKEMESEREEDGVYTIVPSLSGCWEVKEYMMYRCTEYYFASSPLLLCTFLCYVVSYVACDTNSCRSYVLWLSSSIVCHETFVCFRDI